MQCVPQPVALATWSERHGLTSPDGDLGYVLHALLRAAFGDPSPQPFRYLGTHRGLLAYSSKDRGSLREQAAVAPPDLARALGLDGLDARPFPDTWRPGQRLGFEVRVRPVIRTNAGRERDAYQYSLETRAETQDTSKTPLATPSREDFYCDWLARQVRGENAAHLLTSRMETFRLSRVLRKTGADAKGRRKPRQPMGPDTVLTGELEIDDPGAFARLVRRGVGRHRAFGFGMLLLRRASSC